MMREGFCMKRKPKAGWNAGNVVFRAALEPLEAAMLPAGERAPRGALKQAKNVWERLERGDDQRQKIWVR